MAMVDDDVENGVTEGESSRVERRRLLRRGAITAAVAAAATAAFARPSAAADNDSVPIGSANDAHNTGTPP